MLGVVRKKMTFVGGFLDEIGLYLIITAARDGLLRSGKEVPGLRSL